MKKGIKRFWISVMALLALLCLFCGCKLGESVEGLKQQYNLTAQVNYYANGGLFETSKPTKTIYYAAGQKAAPIGQVDAGSTKISRDNYDFLGWYVIEVDTQGNLVYADETLGFYKAGEKFDFSKTVLKQGDVYNLCAVWGAHSKVVVKLSLFDETETADKATKIQDKDNAALSYGWGSDVDEFNYDAKGEVGSRRDSYAPFKVASNAYTYINLYMDEACTQSVVWPLKQPTPAEDGSVADVTIYAKYIQGDWKTVKDDGDVFDMFANYTQGGKYYLLGDIDCSKLSINSLSSFDGELRGNGYSLKKLNVSDSGVGNGAIAFLGEIKATAIIKDITFAELTVSYTVLPESDVETYFVFTSVASGAIIENVAVSGTLSIECNEERTTFQAGLKEGTAWLFGGYNADTEYVGGVTVSQESKLLFNGTQLN
ncbi:MAG: hypothetical protein IJX88_06395 [Clostridia bacterium]|nr:hypothetical protein [Clostridia bacterium]